MAYDKTKNMAQIKNLIGRPTKMTKEVIAKLEDAFALGHSDEEACIIAQIDMATLYRYCQKNKSFAIKKELLKHSPKVVARRNIVKDINEGNVDTSKWYMERKAGEEFTPKHSSLISSQGGPIQIIFGSDNLPPEMKELIKTSNEWSD